MGLFRRRPATDVMVDERIGTEADTEDRHRSAVQAGVPGRCPDCDGFGYIDQIDMIHRTQTQHCRDCGHVWSFSFDEAGDVIDLTDDSLAAAADEERSTY